MPHEILLWSISQWHTTERIQDNNSTIHWYFPRPSNMAAKNLKREKTTINKVRRRTRQPQLDSLLQRRKLSWPSLIMYMIDWVKVLRPTWHRIGHFWEVPPGQFLGLVLKKLNQTIRKSKQHRNKWSELT